jgi:hypothetical protein
MSTSLPPFLGAVIFGIFSSWAKKKCGLKIYEPAIDETFLNTIKKFKHVLELDRSEIPQHSWNDGTGFALSYKTPKH